MDKRAFIAEILNGKSIEELLPPMPSFYLKQFISEEEIRTAVKNDFGGEPIFHNGRVYLLNDPKKISWFNTEEDTE